MGIINELRARMRRDFVDKVVERSRYSLDEEEAGTKVEGRVKGC